MKTRSKTANIALSAFALMSASTLTGVAGPEVEAPEPVAEKGGSILDSIHLFGTARLRYEYADMEYLDESYVVSLRARYGIKTDAIAGFKFLAEGESTAILTGSNHYGAFPPPNNNGHSIIADPDNFELNRLQLSYNIEAIDTNITVGRQYIKFADQRFIGAIGWRQNDQTFDAVKVENNSFENFSFTYAYVDQVNRIFGDQTPAPALDKWTGESHLIHTEYTGIENHTVRAFAYLLQFDNAAANSTDTYGLELQGKNGNLNYLFTAALQTDAGNNTKDYQEYYFRGKLGVDQDCCNFGVGFEVMTSDGKGSKANGGQFLFPVGTNHAFNGFADAYLGTNPRGLGLVDLYAWVGTKALGMKHTFSVHNFSEESGGVDLGWEFDYVAAKPIGENAKLILKAAHLIGDGPQRDITRASAEINYNF